MEAEITTLRLRNVKKYDTIPSDAVILADASIRSGTIELSKLMTKEEMSGYQAKIALETKSTSTWAAVQRVVAPLYSVTVFTGGLQATTHLEIDFDNETDTTVVPHGVAEFNTGASPALEELSVSYAGAPCMVSGMPDTFEANTLYRVEMENGHASVTAFKAV